MHPLVEQVRFARTELKRALDGVTDEEARRRLEAMNSISWMICHLAGQERRYWLQHAQGINDVAPELDEWGGWGKPANTPPLDAAWAAWEAVVAAVDPFLDGLTEADMTQFIERAGRKAPETTGTRLQRVLYHYFFHIGESIAIRQVLGHTDLPEFIGDLGVEAPYRAS